MNIEVESEFDAAGVTGKALVRYDVRITCTPTRATLEYPGDPLEYDLELTQVDVYEVCINDLKAEDWPTYDKVRQAAIDAVDDDEIDDQVREHWRDR